VHNVKAMRSALCAWVLCALAGVAYSVCWGTAASSCFWSRPLLQHSGLLSVDKRDAEPGPAVRIGSSPVRRSGLDAELLMCVGHHAIAGQYFVFVA